MHSRHSAKKKVTTGRKFTKGQPEAQAAELDLEWVCIGKISCERETGIKHNNRFERGRRSLK